MNSDKNHFDTIIIGGGLAGLVVASQLKSMHKKILILEGQDHLGGSQKSVTFPHKKVNNGLRLFPNNPQSQKALQFVNQVLTAIGAVRFDWVNEEYQPVTIENGKLVPFVSFGERTPEFFEQMSPFLNPNLIKPQSEVFEWCEALIRACQSDALTKSYVTKIEVENQSIKGVIVNGTKSYTADRIVYTGPIKHLSVLLGEQLSTKQKSKISKGPYCHTLYFDICHTQLTSENYAVHILEGGSAEDIGPVLGRFQPIQNEYQVSQWLSFVDSESGEDSEVLGSALKKIKRQIKRAYPEAFQNIKVERIVLQEYSGGGEDLKLTNGIAWPDIKGLWIGTGTVNSEPHLIGTLLQVEKIVQTLKESQTEETSFFVDLEQPL